MTIEEQAQDRGIRWLVHFTQLSNLPSILQLGLLPRQNLQKMGLTFMPNDKMREDHWEQYNCLSVEFPNYKMFYAKRQECPGSKWIVLLIHALSVLTDPATQFCPRNLAGRGAKAQTFCGGSGLTKLFLGKRDGLRSAYPTDPQAEVICPNPIPPREIRGVCIESRAAEKIVQELIREAAADCTTVIRPELFLPREDWERWKKQRYAA